MVRILHLDDNGNDRELVKRELGRVFPNLHLQEARNQREMNLALETSQFDLIITDYQLNWSNGLAVLQAVKCRFPNMPVVMFTGSGNEEIAVEAMKAGLDDYVIKSSKHAIRLVTAVRAALEKADACRRTAEAERERTDLLRREQEARTEAERLLQHAQEADRKKDEFLAMLAHELRNPLSPITNAVHLLQQAELSEDQSVRVRDMLGRQVKHLGSIVDDLLDVTRITRGMIELRRERVDLARLLRDAVEDHRTTLEHGRLESAMQVPGEPVWVRADRTRINQVIGNLLQNAAKFTNSGGRVAAQLVVDYASQQAVLTVQDNGIGIDSELLPRVFEMFTQADRSLDRNRGGLGLGLALVKGLIELHGGRVHAASEGPDKGAQFSVHLPLDNNEEAQVDPHEGNQSGAGALRILIIEDSKDGAESLRLLLALHGHEVRVAYTGVEGVQTAQAFRPAVILCDLGLPGGMNGYEVAQALRHDPATAPARLIAVSGYGQPEDQARARAAGFDLHLTKPVDPSVLRQRLEGP